MPGKRCQLVRATTADVTFPGNTYGSYNPTRFNCRPEHAKLRCLDKFGYVGNFHAITHVRLVVSKTQHRFVVCHPRKRTRLHLEARDRNQFVEQILGKRQNVFHVNERHLKIKLRKLGLTVGALVLITEAARDLVVPVHPADH